MSWALHINSCQLIRFMTGLDLGKLWVSGFGPWEPAAAKQHLTLSKGRTRHPQNYFSILLIKCCD